MAWPKDPPGQGYLARDRGTILAYYRGAGGNLPPGLAKRGGDLPPGLERQLRRNGTLPPGLQKRLVPFPAELEGRLVRLPASYQRATLGRVAIVWDRRRGVVIDIMSLEGR